jgi:transposase
VHAAEQDRPDVLKKCEAWFEGQVDLDPERLVFIDDTWASTNIARRYGRCRRGERLRVGVPHGHWKTTTFVGALTLRGFVAPWMFDGPINRGAFETYVETVLVLNLRPGDVVIIDNFSSHKGDKVRELIEAAGATLRFLPPYSSDFNPIENAFAKLKALLKEGRRADRDGPLVHDRPPHRPVHPDRMPQLLRCCWIRCNVNEFCSSVKTRRRLTASSRRRSRLRRSAASGRFRSRRRSISFIQPDHSVEATSHRESGQGVRRQGFR